MMKRVKKKRLVVLGSTGSIGCQTLDIVRALADFFEIIAMSAHSNKELFAMQCKEFAPRHAVVTSESKNSRAELGMLAQLDEADCIVNAIVGVAGVMSTLAAVRAGKTLALANKESLVMAGELVMQLAHEHRARILPIDSEPSAIWQIVNGNMRDAAPTIERITLTASGGPFYGKLRDELRHVTPEQALAHPTWKMGAKISVDSATLMNKAFELIETRWLFNIPPEKLAVSIHRQSIVHALVHWTDGSVGAAMSPPDMRIPISQALFYPDRAVNPEIDMPRLDFSNLQLQFEAPDYSTFEAPKLAYEVMREGGILPAVFCMADEIAVQKFLRREIEFLDIVDEVKRTLDVTRNTPLSVEALNELFI